MIEIKNLIVFVTYNNDKDKIENCSLLGDIPYVSSSDLHNSLTKLSEYYSINRLKEASEDIPDIDLLYYYVPDNWIKNPEREARSNLIRIINENNISPFHSDNTLVLEFKRLARISNDIKTTTDPIHTAELILKYKDEPGITKQQIYKLITFGRITPLSDSIKNILIETLPQTKYFGSTHINKDIRTSDFIHPLDLFFSSSQHFTQQSLSDLFWFQNSTSLEECLEFINKYSGQKEITQIQVNILGIKLNPSNIYSLKNFCEFDAKPLMNTLEKTVFFKERMLQVGSPIALSFQILQYIREIQELRIKLSNPDIDFDERKLLRDILHHKTNSYFELEIASLQSLPDSSISPVTLKRLQNISTFYTNHFNYTPSPQLNKDISLLSEKFRRCTEEPKILKKNIDLNLQQYLKQQISQHSLKRKKTIHT